MSRHSSKRPLWVFGGAALAVSMACSGGGLGGGCGGTSCLGQIPGGWYQGPKTDDPVAVRLSAAGISYINANWQALVDGIVDGGVMHVPVACAPQNTSVGNFVIADQGGPGCNSQSCGQMDGKCDNNPASPTYDQPADIPIQITGLQLQTTPPDTITATVKLSIVTPKIYIDTQNQNYPACAFITPAECSVTFDSRQEPNGGYNQLGATVQFAIDTKWDKLMSFHIVNLDGTQICDPNGNPPQPPDCIDVNEVNLNGENTCGGVWCGGIGNFVIDYILPYVAPLIQSYVTSAVNKQSCEQCGKPTDLSCLQLPPNAASSCNSGLCTDNANPSACVPRFLGVQGRLAPGTTSLGKYGIPPNAQMDLTLALGSAVGVDTGMSLSTRGGVQPVGVASCVPALTPPLLPALTAPDLDGEAPAVNGGYHVALGVSGEFLNLALYGAQQSGALCLDVGSAQFGIINSGTFKTFLPSLGVLATRDGNDAPMIVALRPQSAPTVAVGAGTFDGGTAIDPLIDFKMKDVAIDFYAMIDDRYALLFTLTADIDFPFSLNFIGGTQVEPAIGNVQQLATNVRTSPSKIIAEDPAVLQNLVPAVLGFAQPALASLLKPFNIPAVGGFQPRVDCAKGVQKIAGTPNYNYMAIYAQLGGTAGCRNLQPKTVAHLKGGVMPAASEMRLSNHPLPLPVAVLDVRAENVTGPVEFDYRVDEGFWHLFAPANERGELQIADQAFLIQGPHLIEVRSRSAEQPGDVSTPVAVDFVVDWEPPEVRIDVDQTHRTIRVLAHDVVTPAAQLQYAYRVGPEGAWSDYGSENPIDFAAVDSAGGVAVRVRDEAGNVGEASYLNAVSVVPGSRNGASPESGSRSGCGAGAVDLAWFSLLGGLGWLRRRRRALW